MAATMVPITSITLSASAASVTFSGIPQTYTDLMIRASARGVSDTATNIKLNGVGGTAYSERVLYGNGSSAGSYAVTNNTDWQQAWANDATATANTFSSVEFYLPNYTTSTAKPASTFATPENNATAATMRIHACLWNNTGAVTTISISNNLANFVAGSSFHLYGIKNS